MSTRRQKDFKRSVDGEEARRRRETNGLQLRKQKREEGLAKRRNVHHSTSPSPSPTPLGLNNSATNVLANNNNNNNGNSNGALGPSKPVRNYTAADIPSLSVMMGAPDIEQQLTGTRGIRKVLSIEHNPPVEAVLKANLLPLLVSFLSRHENPDLQFEAAWALTNIASTEQTAAVVNCGAVEPLSQLLQHSNADIREQCAWCLGNIAGDCTELRDLVLGSNALNGLLANIAQPATISLLRNCVWSLSNFCRGKPQPPIELIQPALPALVHLLSSEDREVLTDAGWALSYLSDGDNKRIQVVLDAGVTPTLANLLAHSQSTVVTPALRTLGNIVTGDDSQTQTVLQTGALGTLTQLLRHTKKAIRKEACWMLSNIAAGSTAQITELCQAPGVLSGVVCQLATSEWDVQKEAAWVVSNIATGGTSEHVRALVDAGVIAPLCDLLDTSDSKVVMVTMDALEAVLKIDESGDFMIAMEEADGLDRLEKLQEHANEQVYKKAVSLIETYFGTDDNEDSNGVLMPTVTVSQQDHDESTYNFGIMPQQMVANQPVGGFNFS